MTEQRNPTFLQRFQNVFRHRPWPPRREAIGVITIAIVLVLATVVVFVSTDPSSPTTNSSRRTASSTEEVEEPPEQAKPSVGDFTVKVDTSLRPSSETIEGLEPGDPERRVARLSTTEAAPEDGPQTDLTSSTDVVLDEVIVSTKTQKELDDFFDRRQGDVLDSFEFEDGTTDHLIRLDLDTVEVGDLAADLVRLEPHSGELSVGDPGLQALLTVVAQEGADHGLEVSVNYLEESTAIVDGEIRDDDALNNTFDWWYMQGGGHDFSVAPAWQLMEANGVFDSANNSGVKVPILIHDSGFVANPDFPKVHTLRYAEWGERNKGKCTGGSDCPFHASDVTLAAMAKQGNEWGVAGPAGPVGELVAISAHRDGWKALRKLSDSVKDHRPRVVNMSYDAEVGVGRRAAENLTNRHYKAMVDRGATLVAAAGNSNKDVDTRTCVGNRCSENRYHTPCENKHVICVGGLDKEAIQKADQSNFGLFDDNESVELWGPFNMRTIQNHQDDRSGTTRVVFGTSISSPFVAGVAALVIAADPTLSPGDVRRILRDTATTE